MKVIIQAVLITIISAIPTYPATNIVATLPWIGSITKEIGGDKINITTLVKPSEDPHYLEAKPSMIVAARRADLLIYNGIDLEVGYLPLIIESSKNPKIQPGKSGNLNCSQYIKPIEVPATFDRSMGDIHPLGNPHYHLSPDNILKVAEGIADTLITVDGKNGDYYSGRLSEFKKKLQSRKAEWMRVSLKGRKFIAVHKYFEYLSRDMGFQIVDYLEAKPGIPPSPSHLEELLNTIKREKPEAILSLSYYRRQELQVLKEKTGIKIILLPNDVGSMPEASDWFSLMDQIIKMVRG